MSLILVETSMWIELLRESTGRRQAGYRTQDCGRREGALTLAKMQHVRKTSELHPLSEPAQMPEAKKALMRQVDDSTRIIDEDRDR